MRTLILPAVLLLAACAGKPANLTTGEPEAGMTSTLAGATKGAGRIGVSDCGKRGAVTLPFTDSELFDQNMVFHTREGYNPIVINDFGNRRPEDVPPRLMSWLYQLKQREGKVETKTEIESNGTRNLLVGWLLEIVMNVAKEARNYGGLYNYNAELVARQIDIAGSAPVRTLKRVQFNCRPAAGTAPAAPATGAQPVNPIATPAG
jgi:hypothetical protein